MPNASQTRSERIKELYIEFAGQEVAFDQILHSARDLWPEVSRRTLMDYACSVIDKLKQEKRKADVKVL
jgi:hypothetical protein